jgi:hypothetical protein
MLYGYIYMPSISFAFTPIWHVMILFHANYIKIWTVLLRPNGKSYQGTLVLSSWQNFDNHTKIIANINRLLLSKETVTVYSENYKNDISELL